MSMLRLVGVPLCPYVQRVAIVLHEKRMAYERADIDLKWPPAWVLKHSPLVKVPLLMDGERALFESQAICEYLDTLAAPALQPLDAWQRARLRAYIALADELLTHQYTAMTDVDTEAWETAQAAQRRLLTHLESEIVGPYFAGANYALVDAAYAPYAQRLCLLEAWHRRAADDDEDLRHGLPRIECWLQSLSTRATTNAGAGPDFAQRFQRFLQKQPGGNRYR